MDTAVCLGGGAGIIISPDDDCGMDLCLGGVKISNQQMMKVDQCLGAGWRRRWDPIKR